MKTSNEGLKALIVSEGISIAPYKDTVGVWTIGVGHTKSAGAPDPIQLRGTETTVEKMIELFRKDVVTYENIVIRNVKVPLLQREFDALVHFVYNIGEPNFKGSKLLTNLNAGKKHEAFDKGFHGWLKQPELRSRRDKERAIALDGKYGGSVATLFTADYNGKLKTKGTVNVGPLLKVSEKPVQSVPERKDKSLLEIIIDFVKGLFGWK